MSVNGAKRRWSNMIRRCHYPEDISYKNYGARGISVCDRWRFGEDGKTGFECFFEDMGPCPRKGLTLDRVNNDKGYSKYNCRWSTYSEQAQNQRPKKNTTQGLRVRVADLFSGLNYFEKKLVINLINQEIRK